MIETIKIQGDGYLVNGALSVPKVDGNRHYEEVKLAIAGGNDDYPTAIIVEPEFTDAELLQQEQTVFRAERDKLLQEADIEIYRLEDNNLDASAWRTYRQALRDATLTWVMPEKPQ